MPTVDLGLRDVVFCSIEMAGDKPSIKSNESIKQISTKYSLQIKKIYKNKINFKSNDLCKSIDETLKYCLNFRKKL